MPVPHEAGPGATIDHIGVAVTSIAAALAFYRDVLGFELTGRLGDQAAFLSAGGYHPPINCFSFTGLIIIYGGLA